MDLVKLKNAKEFPTAPEHLEDTLKNNIASKFTDIYQLIGQLIPRSDF